jgi:hypothetical protein
MVQQNHVIVIILLVETVIISLSVWLIWRLVNFARSNVSISSESSVERVEIVEEEVREVRTRRARK